MTSPLAKPADPIEVAKWHGAVYITLCEKKMLIKKTFMLIILVATAESKFLKACLSTNQMNYSWSPTKPMRNNMHQSE